MKKSSLIVLTIFSLFQLVSCRKNNESVVNVSIVENVSTSENKISENSEININTNSNDENISSIEIIEDNNKPNINLNKKELVLTLNKSEYLTVNFPTDYNNDSSLGKWESSNSSIVEVSKYGKVTAKAVGTCYVTYITSSGDISSKCVIDVYEANASIKRAWNKVTDMDSIKNGDILIFGCPEFGVTATYDVKSGYILTTEASFSSNGAILTDFGADTCQFFVGEAESKGEILKNVFTLENEEGLYLTGRKTERGNALSFVKSKGQKNWIFETPKGYSKGYTVNNDIETDLWLMFNKISSSDIRFNLYDSNETTLMKVASIYRKEIVKNK